MKWDETVASNCRYGEIAGKIWGNWEILWEDSEADYQGHASFIATKNGRFCFYEWWYGSCSGCDGWEASGATDKEIKKEMRETALWLDDAEALRRWLRMLEGAFPISNYDMERGGGLAVGIDILSDGLGDRINAIRQYFDLSKIEDEEA